MADDIGSRGEDPRDVARRRRNIGRRLREGQVRTAQGQASGPSMTPSTQSMVPYQERLPTAPEGGRGERGGPPATSGGREMAAPRGENVPAMRREGMPSIRVPQGAADMMRGAMQSPMARAMGTGRAAAGRAAVEGAMRLGDRLMRGGRSPAARTPAGDLGDEAPEAPRPVPTADYEESMRAGEAAGRPAPRQQPARGAARAAPREMTADDLNEIVLRLNRGEKPVTETEKRLADRMGIAYRKGGMVKGKGMHMMPDGSMMKNKDHAAMKKGGKAMMYREGGKVRQGMQSPKAQEARAEMAEDVMKRSMPAEPKRRMRDMMSPEDRREYDAPLTTQERDRMRESGFKKGGMIKPKTAMKKGGVVKKAAGGKVAAPKKMMKGGVVAKPKPKKMMGGGRAMYAKGGMAKGKC